MKITDELTASGLSDYLARFVTIGAENAEDAETRRLVHDLEQVISICEGGSWIIVTED